VCSSDLYSDTGDIENATTLRKGNCSTSADAGWYKDESNYVRYWNGSVFTSTVLCGAGYYDCGYGCQYYTYDPLCSGCTTSVNVRYNTNLPTLCSGGGTSTTIYHPTLNYLSEGETYYSDTEITLPISDTTNYFVDENTDDYGKFNSSGVFELYSNCV
jgi:hypothetical protein